MIRVLSTRIARPINTFAKEQNIIIRSLATGKETYTERQAKKGRPVSPHVTIYAFPAAAISSITNRVTGVVLWGGEIRFIFCLIVLFYFCFRSYRHRSVEFSRV